MKSNERFRRRVVAAGLALIGVLIGSAGYDGWRLHQQIMAANERELGNLAKALTQEAFRSLQSVDLLLRETAAWYQTGAAELDAAAITRGLASRAVGAAQVSVVTIVDARGMQRYRSRPTGAPLADVSDRPYFQSQRARASAGLFINEPIVTRSERVPALVISRRLNTRSGDFDGVVTAIVTLQQLGAAYNAIALGDNSALFLTLSDGTLVVRQPPAPELEGRVKFTQLAELKTGALVDRSVSPVDGRPKLISALPVGDLPLILAITRDEEVALRPWYDEMWRATVRTALLAVLVLATIAALLRQLRRLERGERALRQSEERYAMAMEAANEGHAEWNIADQTVFASAKWRLLHGLDGTAVIATIADVRQQLALHPDEAAAVAGAIDDHLRGRTPAIELEYRVRDAAGWRWIHARGRCQRADDGRPLRLFCAATDVSERKRAEADQASLAARLQQTQRLEALGTLAGGIAHDFNNILGAILGFGEMAQQRAEPGSALNRYLDRVMQAGARARLLVRRILDFSRSGVGERVPVNLQAVVEEVIAVVTPGLPPGLHLQARLESGNAAVVGDATQLYQVVMNLCTNAVHAMGGGGAIDVTLRCVDVEQPGSFLHGAIEPGRYVRLDVADTGAGIAPELLQRIFEPFYTTKKVGEGTGLGLSVVHGIVSNLGGAIDVAARDAGGTRVTVWLPFAGDAERLLDAPAPVSPNGAGEVVMIVDDEPALVELAEELLAQLGYEPVGFATGEAALDAFRRTPGRFDAVLSDEMLPGLQGSELARQLRQLQPDLPVVLMSGKVGAALEARARDAGVAALLHKPLALQQLAENLARVLRRRAPADAAARSPGREVPVAPMR